MLKMGNKQSLSAIAHFDKKTNNGIFGVVLFTPHKNKTACDIRLSGFEPNTTHAIHIHEYGDLRMGCGTCGGHYNPHNKKHGALGLTSERHVGDLVNNITSDSNGQVLQTYIFSDIDITDILGRSVVIHYLPDDLGLQGMRFGNKLIKYHNMSVTRLKHIAKDRNYEETDREKLVAKLEKESLVTGNAGGRMGCSVIGILNSKK
jgi:Cu/Zn superoxide dismutase